MPQELDIDKIIEDYNFGYGFRAFDSFNALSLKHKRNFLWHVMYERDDFEMAAQFSLQYFQSAHPSEG